MATPADLEDFAVGLSLTEGIIDGLAEIDEITPLDVDRGIDLQVRLHEDAADRQAKRRRSMAGPVGCGLCGVESLDAAMRDVPIVKADLTIRPEEVAEAVGQLADAQALNHITRSVHASGFYRPGEGVKIVREDVGRHNALDKLIGALARSQTEAATGVFVMTSRLSVELVQKTAIAGCGILIAISAPTALAVETAEAVGITLIAIARNGEFALFTHPDRLVGGSLQDVA